MKKISIAIDGPSAAGKSTIAKMVAKKLEYVYIDTGAMYRCVAYYALKNNIDLDNEDKICESLNYINIRMDNNNNVYLNDENVSNEIRSNEVSLGASKVSSYQLVREFLVKQQRNMANGGGVILDGRDIGTVVLKDAELKIYQIASVDTRAMRRYNENKERGMDVDLKMIKREIEQRDYQDTHRIHSPLKKADDAIIIDTSLMSLDQVVDYVIELVNKVKENTNG